MKVDPAAEERSRFIKGTGGKELLRTISNSVSALQWGSPPADHNHRNGSIFFIDTGQGIFGVTARHVYEDYERSLAERYVSCQIDNLRFDPIERLVSKGIECDVATFRIEASELKRLERLTIPWPPKMPMVGNAILFAGIPGCEKRFPELNRVDFGKYVAMAGVTSVSDRDISIVLPPNEDIFDTLEVGLPPRQYDMGGMSGGPIAVVMDNANILSWALSGVIYESHQDFEIVKACRADFIDEDGLISC